jgi:hypothetical protein
MSTRSGPYWYAWCAPNERSCAFADSISLLIDPSMPHSVEVWGLAPSAPSPMPAKELIELVSAVGARTIEIDGPFTVHARPASAIWGRAYCYAERHDSLYAQGPLRIDSYYEASLCPEQMDIALYGGKRAEDVEAVIASMQTQEDTEGVLLRLCAPGDSTHVVTGCLTLYTWWAPMEVAATYHVDGRVARDLALSWIYIHDGDRVGRIAGLSLEDLTARVEAAPPGTQVGVAEKRKHVFEHFRRDSDAETARATRPTHPGAIRRVPRDILPTDVLLSREQVLSALATPKEALLEALDAAAVPDDTWRSVEPQALEMIAAKNQGAPTYEVNVATGGHVHFIEQHAPYHVRRLPNGGVMLATHPYRTLWPLWQDALFLLGITP